MSKFNVYKSCGCAMCRHCPPSRIRGEDKREAHRLLRRESKRLLERFLTGIEDGVPLIPIISTGYKS
jgi:hypothetical protein